MRSFLVIMLIVMISQTLAAAETKAMKPLFLSDEVLQVRLELPLEQIMKQQMPESGAYSGRFMLLGDQPLSFDITATPRGNSRQMKEVCRFPPLKLDFSKKQVQDTLLHGQNKLKLVTYCRDKDTNTQYNLLEYAAYRMFNYITDFSYRARLLKITYVDSQDKDDEVESYGILIEDVDDLASRHGMIESSVGNISKSSLDPQQAALVAVFQYMIGNLDWSMVSTEEGAPNCCHNARLLQLETESGHYYPVVYDFDYSGLVNTLYAVAPPKLHLKSVRSRRYRGFCIHNDQIDAALALFKSRQQVIMQVIDDLPELTRKRRSSAKKFLYKFFSTISSKERIEREFKERCRGEQADDETTD